MDADPFESTLADDQPPEHWSQALQALWWEARGDWNRAHDLVQAGEGEPRCDWVHAYLHRMEGDLSNAAYWYRRAGKPAAAGSLTTERDGITKALLKQGS